jgi:hypothetical protein
MAEESTSSEAEQLGYTGCRVYLALRKQTHGAVEKLGSILSLQQAIDARKNCKDVVVCGDDGRQNLQIAEMIESRATDRNHKFHSAHLRKGKRTLPHYQHRIVEDAGHTFYESPPRFVIANRDSTT